VLLIVRVPYVCLSTIRRKQLITVGNLGFMLKPKGTSRRATPDKLERYI
jgi:hypothetical protein